ncbi:MAG: energy transducer TonB [Chitinophagaceae bacterium]|nr:energy transducer TonB [Chitinophagaceae bacterium]
MRNVIFALSALLYSSAVFSQQKEFEGKIVYKIESKSKTEGISDKAVRNALCLGDSLVVHVRQGNYRRTSAGNDEYYIASRQKVFLKFRGIDTLYYLDYNSDSTVVLGVSKSGEQKKIAGYDCKSISVKTASYIAKYFFAPVLYINPEYDKNNTISRYDAYIRETSSIWLALNSDYNIYELSQTCLSVKETPVDMSVFSLPDLPEKKFSMELITVPPEFTRKGGWIKYIETSLNPDVANKYLKISRRETTAEQTVIVEFIISEKGRVLNAVVLNKKEVHPRLAEEALRVISESPVWRPAMALGEKVPSSYTQPVTFQAIKQ